MNRAGMDLVLLLVLIINIMVLLDPNATEERVFSILIVGTLVMLLYVSFVIGPHYLKKISNDDLRRICRNLVLYIPLIILMGILAETGHIDLEDPERAKMEIGMYFLAGITALNVIGITISHLYRKKKEREQSQQS